MNRVRKIFVIVFLLLLALPGLGMLVFGASSAGANEVLSEKPHILGESGGINTNYLTEVSDYFADRYCLRQEMITAWNMISVKLFRTSPDSQVIVGSGGWLYYGASLNDYRGEAASDAAVYAAAKNLLLIQEYAENSGADFVFTAAPNKNTLYPQFMPADIIRGHDSSVLAKLEPMLNSCGVNYADICSAFSNKEILYYETDSHWNDRGAALAADTILAEFGIASSFYASDFSDTGTHRGDLYNMLFPKGTHTEAYDKYSQAFDFVTERDPNNGEALNIKTANTAAQGSLYCWRDSFGVSLYPYLAESFGNASFTRSANYDVIKAVESDADHIVLEIVERNILNLARSAPALPAPVRPCPTEAIVCEAENIQTEKYNDTLFRLSGSLKNIPDSNSAVYICADGVYYEACIVADNGGINGFSALVPQCAVDAIYIV